MGLPFDRVLGQLDDRDDVDVHARVAHYVNRPGSEPNELHQAIVSVARASPAVRIVTTNYDRHLSTALDASSTDYSEYLAPALPLGDDFDGLLYLHGSLNQEPRRLVVTDADFGRAYLSSAWAARFLERLFADKSVLFIGYSHSDVIMTYFGAWSWACEKTIRPYTRPGVRQLETAGYLPCGLRDCGGVARRPYASIEEVGNALIDGSF